MADELSEEQIAEYLRAFKHIDRNQDGSLNCKELLQVLQLSCKSFTISEVQDMMSAVDSDGNGTLDFPEFLQMMATKHNDEKNEGEVKEAFRFFDKDGNGHISSYEFRQVMQNLGEKLTEKEIDHMLLEADRDGDGQINYEEFFTWMNNAE